MNKRFSGLANAPLLPYAVTIGAIAYFLVRAFQNAHGMFTILDEGTYLTKGLWFISGQYTPFQPDGPWTNKMPLAFIIPGIPQAVFGPGLRTGRYFAIFLSVLILAGLWVATRRVSTTRWAVVIVLVTVLNPFYARVYTFATAQSLAALLLVWSIALAVDPKRRHWQLALGIALSVLLLFTRINLSPALPAVLLYIALRDGLRVAGPMTIFAGVLFVVINAFYFPEITNLYYEALEKIIPVKQEELGVFSQFLWPVNEPERLGWSLDPTLDTRLSGFFLGLRYNLAFILAGFTIPLLGYLRRVKLPAQKHQLLIPFGALWVILFVLHLKASVGGSYCVFCFEAYLTFFVFLSGILLANLLHDYEFRPWPVGTWVMPVLSVGLFVGLGYGARDFVNERIVTPYLTQVFYSVLRWPLDGEWQRVFPWVSAQYGLDHAATLDALIRFSRQVAGPFVGLLFGLVFLIGMMLFVRFSRRDREYRVPRELGYSLLFGLLAFSVFASPFPFLGQQTRVPQCGDVLLAQERIGARLRALLPEGATVYWGGYKSAAPLLYVLEDIETFPAQVNGSYSYHYGADVEVLRLRSLWGPELAEQWIAESDYALVNDIKDFMDHQPDYWEVVEVLPPQDTCSDEGRLVLWVNSSRVQP